LTVSKAFTFITGKFMQNLKLRFEIFYAVFVRLFLIGKFESKAFANEDGK
jgi:hypothetical protein